MNERKTCGLHRCFVSARPTSETNAKAKVRERGPGPGLDPARPKSVLKKKSSYTAEPVAPAKDPAAPPPAPGQDGSRAGEVQAEDRKIRNALGLRVEPSVEMELQELGMDPAVLLEPLTPRSLMTGTPYPGKRSSVVLGGGLAADRPVWRSSQHLDADSSPSDTDLPADVLPALAPREQDGTLEPPATPVGRDELALRRHRFFSDLLTAAQAAADHRVRFDPMGPAVAGRSPH